MKIREYIRKIISVRFPISEMFIEIKFFQKYQIFFPKLSFIFRNKKKFIDYCFDNLEDKTNFVKDIEDKYNFNDNAVKLISFYLPQFHDFEENVKWFGKGFSEWINTSKTMPQFIGHYQPHIPIDFGYYNLNTNDTIKPQIELAKKYGIYGFSFYYYWFSGKKIMEKPLENFLKDKSLNMPFFLFWANEDWTMLWDNGKDKEILHKQELLEQDARKFMEDALKYFKDERYIKIDNKPILIIYDTNKYDYEKYLAFIYEINKIAVKNGFDGLYIMSTPYRAKIAKLCHKEFVEKFKLDALCEFVPQEIDKTINIKKEVIFNKKAKVRCFDIEKYIKEKKYLYDSNVNLFKTCFPSWDNTPRKCYNGSCVFQSSPKNYKIWLKDLINWTKKNKRKEEQFVFINAWNEWAEGAHLEPDRKFGYAYLKATKEALEETK